MVQENYKTITQQDSHLITTSAKQKKKKNLRFDIFYYDHLKSRLTQKCRDLSRARTISGWQKAKGVA